MSKRKIAGLRLFGALALSCTLTLVVSSLLARPVEAHVSGLDSPHAPEANPACVPAVTLTGPLSPTVLTGQNRVIYTLTNAASCADTFDVSAGSHFLLDRWSPVTAALDASQSRPITVYFHILVDAGTITDTLLLTATSQLSPSATAAISHTVIIPGGILPNESVFLPLIVSSP